MQALKAPADINLQGGKLQTLADLQKQIKDFDKEIEHLEKRTGIKQLKDERNKRQKEYDEALDSLVPQLTFSEDRFLKALKLNGKSYREGSLKLIQSTTTRREVIRAKFLEKYKELALKICTIPVGKAEALLGSEELDPLCSKKVTYSYNLIDGRWQPSEESE